MGNEEAEMKDSARSGESEVLVATVEDVRKS